MFKLKQIKATRSKAEEHRKKLIKNCRKPTANKLKSKEDGQTAIENRN